MVDFITPNSFVKNSTSDNRPLYAVIMNKATSKSKPRYFIVVKKGELFLDSVFHGVGFWTDIILEYIGQESSIKDYNIDNHYIEEVWIPYTNIDYITSLMYKQR
ncbi:MAG: hypothetical protein ACXACY_10375 [Candidatus Hodarchaeales archaeon]|jgi:hypothetical protein